MSKLILHLCADTGSDSYPYKTSGYEVITVGSNMGIENYNPPNCVYGVIANPVCTEFSVVNRGFHRHGDYDKGLFLVNHCKRIIELCKPVFYTIENPANGRLRYFLGRPDYVYEPWMFGDPWSKKTALWGRFNKPSLIYTRWEQVPKNNKLYIRPGRSKPSMACLHKSAINDIPSFSMFNVDNDMEFRSLCPQGFATAFFNANR